MLAEAEWKLGNERDAVRAQAQAVELREGDDFANNLFLKLAIESDDVDRVVAATQSDRVGQDHARIIGRTLSWEWLTFEKLDSLTRDRWCTGLAIVHAVLAPSELIMASAGHQLGEAVANELKTRVLKPFIDDARKDLASWRVIDDACQVRDAHGLRVRDLVHGKLTLGDLIYWLQADARVNPVVGLLANWCDVSRRGLRASLALAEPVAEALALIRDLRNEAAQLRTLHTKARFVLNHLADSY